MRHERIFLPFRTLSTLPWGSVWTVSIQTLTNQDRHTLSTLLLMGSCILRGVTTTNPAPGHAAGKPTHCNTCCTCEFVLLMPHIISHILEGTCWRKCKHYTLVELLTLELSSPWLYTYMWLCWSSRDMRNTFRKCIFLFFSVCCFLATVELIMSKFTSASFFLFCTVCDIYEIGFIISPLTLYLF